MLTRIARSVWCYSDLYFLHVRLRLKKRYTWKRTNRTYRDLISLVIFPATRQRTMSKCLTAFHFLLAPQRRKNNCPMKYHFQVALLRIWNYCRSWPICLRTCVADDWSLKRYMFQEIQGYNGKIFVVRWFSYFFCSITLFIISDFGDCHPAISYHCKCKTTFFGIGGAVDRDV